MKYRKKPVVIEARVWNGNFEELLNWAQEINYNNASEDLRFRSHYPLDRQLVIKTLEGPITAAMGDYIICGIKGEFYPCKPDIFKQSYEEAED
jgi:hypothetical protein